MDILVSELPTPALSTTSTRPSSRADRKLRFAEVTPQDVHVYESAPPSPRKKVLLLPPPDSSDNTVISLGHAKSQPIPDIQRSVTKANGTTANARIDPDPDEEEGTPEYIRRRFFPNTPAHDPGIAWMESSLPSDATPSSIRFDLTGAVIPLSISSTLPTHLGLHHHSDGMHAGYTLDDIFLLSRSTVPAQRATMLGVLARIARRLGKAREGGEIDIGELAGKEGELRRRILAAGVEAMGERGSTGMRAVEAIWECVVFWEKSLLDIEGVELEDGKGKDDDDAISSMPLQFFLPQIAVSLAHTTLPTESQLQLLAVLHRFAQHSNDIATAIIKTPDLVSNVVQTFLLTPISSNPITTLPDPSALQFLITLALSSRTNAATLLEPADTLLRFVAMLPPTSPYSTPLAIALLTDTLRLYTILAQYGLYAHTATVAAEPFVQLRKYIASSLAAGESNDALVIAWVGLVEAWTVCATDPHRTTPSHDILWTQVVGWGWDEDLLEWREYLPVTRIHWKVWSAVWQAQASLLEGAHVNGVKGGEEERQKAIVALKLGFDGGKEWDVVTGVVDLFQHELRELRSDECWGSSKRLCDVTGLAKTVAAAIRLWLACTSPPSDSPLDSPPFPLPFSQISESCAQLVNHPLWSAIYSEKAKPYTHVFCRSLTTLLFAYLGLSRVLPGVSDELWMAQAFSILGRSLPGDEEAALHVLEQVTRPINAGWMAARGWHVPPVVWEKEGMTVMKPFLVHAIRPTDSFLGPVWPSPQSISLSTTQRLPSRSTVRGGLDMDSGLPLAKDWTLSPLHHLLRSGISPVFKSFPSPWDASETEVVRASLLFTKIAQEILRPFSLGEFMLTREEIVFGCMKVFMLEHGQQLDDSAGEVFRDQVVEQFMLDLLAPFTITAASSVSSTIPSGPRDNLETVARGFLGPTTPFYQYYTDFVALYDAVSFSHPLFSRLLLPPTSMRYPSDYRKYLWNDFGHILRNVQVPFGHIVAIDIGEYLWPIEDDAQMVQAYLHSLVTDKLSGFLRFLAVHHIACNIWSDLRQGDATSDQRSEKLLLAVVEMGSAEVVRDVVRYRQKQDMTVLPPTCFQEQGEWKGLRLESLERWRGSTLPQRLGALLS